MRKYEIMFIVDPKVPADGIDQINSQTASVVTDGGGQVEEIEKMGVRPLAYQIEKMNEGFYVLLTVEANGEIIKEVERRFRVTDTVVRYLTVRIDEEQNKLDKIRSEREKKLSRSTVSGPGIDSEELTTG